MINFNEIKKVKATKVTLYRAPIITSDYVKKFRKDNELTQLALASILGVKKKTVEKWEQGKNKVSGSSAVLLSLINDDKAILDKLYKTERINTEYIKQDELKFTESIKENECNDKKDDYSYAWKEISQYNEPRLQKVQCGLIS